MEPMKRLIKPAMQKWGLWGMGLRAHRAARWLQRVCYPAAVGLRLGFAVQLRFLPPQFMEQPIFVKLSSITRHLVSPGLPAFRPVSEGDWDLQAVPIFPDFLRVIHFRLMYEMFAEHKPLEETSQYKKMKREILTIGETVDHHFTSIEQVVQHLKRYEPIFNDIKENGYITQEELGNPPFEHEIRVCIGRDGEPVWLTQGTHRLAMAKILDLECVPVGVWTVHKLWAKRCFKKYGGGVLEAVYKGLDDIDYYHRDEKIRSGQTTSPTPEEGLPDSGS